MKIFTTIAFSFLILLFVFVPTTHIFAQSLINANDISVTFTPSSPLPNESVSITISSYTVNLSRSTIKWRVDGTLKKSGIGETTLSIIAKNVGQTTSILVDIVTADGSILTKELSVRPSNIDLLWEAVDSYTPPFYRGKAFMPSEGLVKVVAIPEMKNNEGRVYSDDDLVYTWKRNIDNVPQASGYGKKAFTFKHSYFNATDSVGVSVSSLDNGQDAGKTISLAPVNPTILFYKDSPLEGVEYQTALEDVSVGDTSVSIVAMPYFFGSQNITNNDLGYVWKAGEDAISVMNPKNKLTISKGDSKGRSTISLSIESVSKLFQTAKSSFDVSF